jgi:hypothetical protein
MSVATALGHAKLMVSAFAMNLIQISRHGGASPPAASEIGLALLDGRSGGGDDRRAVR